MTDIFIVALALAIAVLSYYIGFWQIVGAMLIFVTACCFLAALRPDKKED